MKSENTNEVPYGVQLFHWKKVLINMMFLSSHHISKLGVECEYSMNVASRNIFVYHFSISFGRTVATKQVILASFTRTALVLLDKFIIIIEDVPASRIRSATTSATATASNLLGL